MYDDNFVFPMSTIGFRDMSLKEYIQFKKENDVDTFLQNIEYTQNLKFGRFIASGSFGAIYEISKTSVVKMISLIDREEIMKMFDEIVLQFMSTYILTNSSEYQQKTKTNTTARIPKLYKIGYTITRDNTWVLYIIMEKCQKTVLDYVCQKLVRSSEDTILKQTGAILYQLMSLLEILGKVAKYNHCDLKTNNIMITFTNKNHFYISLIDFGYSRFQLGKSVLQLDTTKKNQPYIPGRDIFMFLYWLHGDLCKGTFENMEKGCATTPQILHETILSILKKAKINFNSFQKKINEDQDHWRDLYYLLNKPTRVGRAVELTPYYVKSVAKYLISQGTLRDRNGNKHKNTKVHRGGTKVRRRTVGVL